MKVSDTFRRAFSDAYPTLTGFLGAYVGDAIGQGKTPAEVVRNMPQIDSTWYTWMPRVRMELVRLLQQPDFPWEYLRHLMNYPHSVLPDETTVRRVLQDALDILNEEAAA